MFTALFTEKEIRIYCKGLLHLWIKRDELVSIQSWIEERPKNGWHETWFCIKYYYRDGTTVLSEYEHEEHWEEVLNELKRI